MALGSCRERACRRHRARQAVLLWPWGAAALFNILISGLCHSRLRRAGELLRLSPNCRIAQYPDQRILPYRFRRGVEILEIETQHYGRMGACLVRNRHAQTFSLCLGVTIAQRVVDFPWAGHLLSLGSGAAAPGRCSRAAVMLVQAITSTIGVANPAHYPGQLCC